MLHEARGQRESAIREDFDPEAAAEHRSAIQLLEASSRQGASG